MHSGGPIKRIDSLASSIGATSVRRLLTVVRGGANNSSMGKYQQKQEKVIYFFLLHGKILFKIY